ncbi:TonB-linked outer membrane protein, SusC/RagA family [Chitinophaga jiangningensis]|uniref:TonB-linked outer membrane protein, SusC/RagA family n=1 Tax=Chitinophaga jiangningensis TaxID=1419482 RepID=A0A1M7JAZ5_9BACT|nr:SusC/RagA family TonB-linked outer membrane protein [Chitinophaga jiangningensis]SHM50189.1 TonB-linked outer membrane protein, SusC/RagA family [Chitinophaga jiangningensis]
MKQKFTAGPLLSPGSGRQVYFRVHLGMLTAILFIYSSAKAQVADTVHIVKEPVKNTGVVPVLYGEQDKSRMLQSVATVYTNQLITTPSPQFLQALPGRIPGLNITFGSGGPGLDGNGMGFNIRGARAQTILIDGVERGYQSIDPEQIESISVLKDALSTVMFGQRSSYGIISIKTKKGDVGKPRISFTAQSGFETPLTLPKPLPAWQYATLFNEAKQNDAGLSPVTPQYSPAQIEAYKNQSDPYTYPDVDWYNTVLNNSAGISRYNLNIQGSGKGFRYFVDLDNARENGIFKTSSENKYNTNSQLNRYALRSNVGVDVTPVTFVQLNLFGRFQRYNQPGGGGAGGILGALLSTPQLAYPVFNPDGTLGGSDKYQGNANIWGQTVSRGYQFQDVRDIAVDLEVTQKLDIITKGLVLKAKASNNNTVYYTTKREKNFEVYQYLNDTYTKYGATTEQTTAGGANDRFRIVYLEGSLGYDRTINKHAISVLAVANQQSRLLFSSTQLPENYTAYSGRLNYSFDGKYLAEGAVSYAGYNWLAPAQRHATYWAAGLGWNLHQEAFVSQHLPWISNLRLRANYGLTGQVNAGYYTYIQTYFNNGGYWFGSGSSLERGTGENAIANSGLSPEKAKKLNAGIDLGLWQNKLTLTADYFFNRFYDLVAAPTLTTAVFGAGYPLQNYQRFNYRGADISVNWQQQVKALHYFVTANFSLVQSKVVYNAELPKNYDYQITTGKPVGLQYGYTAIGLFKSYEEINDPATAVMPAAPKSSLRPGDIRYLDRNGDGQITIDDQGPIGNAKPTIYYGLNAGFNFKGIDFSVLFQGTCNRQSYMSGDFMNGFGNGGQNNAYAYNLGRFTPETAATATQPRLWLGSNTNNTQFSSFWLKNTDFVRLKNLEIGYTLPEQLTRKIGSPSVRLFANGLNLLTWSEIFDVREDVDPEAWGAAYPIMKIFNFGINIKF